MAFDQTVQRIQASGFYKIAVGERLAFLLVDQLLDEKFIINQGI